MMMGGGPHRKIEIPTLGVEEEYQIVNAQTRELESDTTALLEEGAAIYGTHIRPEFHSPVVEVVTTVCQNTKEIGEQLSELRRTMIGLARKQRMLIVSASTHPTSRRRRSAPSRNRKAEVAASPVQPASFSGPVTFLR